MGWGWGGEEKKKERKQANKTKQIHDPSTVCIKTKSKSYYQSTHFCWSDKVTKLKMQGRVTFFQTISCFSKFSCVKDKLKKEKRKKKDDVKTGSSTIFPFSLNLTPPTNILSFLMQSSSNKHFKLSDAELILICFAVSVGKKRRKKRPQIGQIMDFKCPFNHAG